MSPVSNKIFVFIKNECEARFTIAMTGPTSPVTMETADFVDSVNLASYPMTFQSQKQAWSLSGKAIRVGPVTMHIKSGIGSTFWGFESCTYSQSFRRWKCSALWWTYCDMTMDISGIHFQKIPCYAITTGFWATKRCIHKPMDVSCIFCEFGRFRLGNE